jgi:predicted metal-binding membrane protein
MNISEAMIPKTASDRAFWACVTLLFALSFGATAVWSASMSAMGGMPMPGGWSMSMTWMRMPGQSWPGAAASFVGMWLVMMVAMMLPCLAPTLARYREAVSEAGTSRLGLRTATVGAGYFFVWALYGLTVFPLGIALAAMEMRQPALARAVPMATGIVIVIAGALQFGAWKSHPPACCVAVEAERSRFNVSFRADWLQGVHLGLLCSRYCANLMAILLLIGIMDLPAMALLTAALAAERLLPAGTRVSRIIGVMVIWIGLFLTARAAAPQLL